MISTGDVIDIFWPVAQKRKYFVCIDPHQHIYFIINSEPRTSVDGQLEVRKYEHQELANEISYLNAGQAYDLSSLDPNNAIKTMQTGRPLGAVSNALRLRIKNAARGSKALQKKFKDVVEQQF